MSRKKQTPVFWPRSDGSRVPMNRAAEREIAAMRRKCLVDPAQHTKPRTPGRAHEREPRELVELRRRFADSWRRVRRGAWYLFA